MMLRERKKERRCFFFSLSRRCPRFFRLRLFLPFLPPLLLSLLPPLNKTPTGEALPLEMRLLKELGAWRAVELAGEESAKSR